MQVAGHFQVLEFLGEPQGQPGEALHERADRQVVSLDVAGAYRVLFVFPYPEDAPPLGSDHFRRLVDDVGVAVFLYDRPELNVGAEG